MISCIDVAERDEIVQHLNVRFYYFNINIITVFSTLTPHGELLFQSAQGMGSYYWGELILGGVNISELISRKFRLTKAKSNQQNAL